MKIREFVRICYLFVAELDNEFEKSSNLNVDTFEGLKLRWPLVEHSLSLWNSQFESLKAEAFKEHSSRDDH